MSQASELTTVPCCRDLIYCNTAVTQDFYIMAALVGRRRLSELRWFSWERSRDWV